ncbi:MAG: T9SS type A sorting domain-containing protein [Bacteroidia bacterium]|nr:T9SS type A sorting domain-containing protein [Bacteroidia bacterium]
MFFTEESAGFSNFDFLVNKKIYPNPAENYITIYKSNAERHIEIVNSIGQVVKLNNYYNRVGFIKIDINDLKSGIYSVMIDKFNYGVFIKK